jgi:hypothetical protein
MNGDGLNVLTFTLKQRLNTLYSILINTKEPRKPSQARGNLGPRLTGSQAFNYFPERRKLTKKVVKLKGSKRGLPSSITKKQISLQKHARLPL